MNLEWDGGDVRFEIKEVIPAAGTAKTKVGGAGNAAGNDWFDDAATKFEVYPCTSVGIDLTSRGATHPQTGSFAVGISHGPITLQGELRGKARLWTKLIAAALGQSKTSVVDATLEYANMSADGSGVYDGAAVTNLQKQRVQFAILLTGGVESQAKPLKFYIKDVQLLGLKTGIGVDGQDEVSISFQATFMYAKFLGAGYA